MSSSMSRIRICLPACDACWRWRAKPLPLTKGANRCGLEVTTQAVERTAEAMGEDIAQQERQQIQQAMQLDLPETAQEFGKRLDAEACHRGWSRAQKKVIMGDGAEWIWNLADLHFPGALQIVDLFHARQHLLHLPRLLYPGEEAHQRQWLLRHQPKLDEGKIQKLVVYLRTLQLQSPELSETA
jgi:hypothetical protein